jgi:hypothetical protein
MIAVIALQVGKAKFLKDFVIAMPITGIANLSLGDKGSFL